MTYHDNEVSISLSTFSEFSLVSGSYIVTSHSVTGGQDPHGYIYDGLVKNFGSDGKMWFRVGRHGSTSTAEWFNRQVKGSQTTFDHSAGKLNFAFMGTLKLTLTGGVFGTDRKTFTFLNVAIAQGHSGASNNWWFGGKNCSYIGSNTVACTGRSSKGTRRGPSIFEEAFDNVNTIILTAIYLIDTTIDTANWMSRIDAPVTLNNIMMPGSHDAGMSELHHCNPVVIAEPYTKTQNKSIGQQLISGSRYFDIRVDYDHEELVTYHRTGATGCNGQALSDIFDEAVSFLQENNTETFIFRISHIRNYSGHDPDDIKKRINSLLDSWDSTIYTNDDAGVDLTQVTLGSVRGKMIIVFDYDNYIDTSTGRFRYKNSSSAQAEPGANLSVFEKYSDTDNYNDMKSDQLYKWKKYANFGANYLFLLSWTLTPKWYSRSVESLASQANSGLPDVLYDQIINQGAKKPNIVYLDFADKVYAQSIIQYNFMTTS